MVMNANDLRRAFVEFFVGRGHLHVPSASLIPHDPTLLFTNSGMVPFKPYFLGEETPPQSRTVSIQKCVRAGGKHNDLEEVGRTSRHLTFFEMLGNFSFGDYFKEQAIPWAWELATEGFGFDPERLWVTVHLTDDDAADIWRDTVGVRADRIQRLDEDNWWRMADTGPNGPCSELFFDKGPEYGDDGGPAHGGDERFLEFWNLVFMQFEQQPDGTQMPLPRPSIDTGLGLERTVSLLQGVDSVWGTDEFVRLLGHATAATGIRDGADPRTDVSLRIFADHARSTTFLVTDGVFPSNEGRGYVLRRILRRAVRHAYILGVEKPVMPAMVDAVVEVMGEAYPELVASHGFVRDVIEREEARFRQTLKTGSVILDDELSQVSGGAPLSGAVAFQLHDTYGFPLELTQEIATERGVDVDTAGFDRAMADQRKRAKDARRVGDGEVDHELYRELVDQFGETEFVRDDDTTTGRVLACVPGLAPDTVDVFLTRTTFYAESGGQVGDIGWLRWGNIGTQVLDTTLAAPGLHRHVVNASAPTPEVGTEVQTVIDRERRNAIRRNHTGTHVLHWALRQVLGDHVKQQGSFVGPDRLRFDFSHYDALTPEQIAEIEDLSNADILGNARVRHFETTMDAARDLGALMFFGDKYGDIVRVLEAGAHSVELCGGTHVSALGDIGPLKVISEGSIGSNLRRIEAVTGSNTVARLRHDERILAELAELVSSPVDELVDGVERRLAETKELRNQVAALRRQLAVGQAATLADSAVGGAVVARVEGVERDTLRDLAVAVRDRGATIAVLGAVFDGGGVGLVAASTPGGPDAGAVLTEAATTVGGGGRKNPELTVIGGKDSARLDEALDQARAAISGS